MSQKQLSFFLKLIIIGLALLGLVFCLLLAPYFAKEVIEKSHLANYSSHWLALVYVVITPCYLVLYNVWKIANSIRDDKSFTQENAKILKNISYITLADTILLIVANIAYALLNMSHPSIVIVIFFIAFVTLAFTVVTASLSHLVNKASTMREENEYTI